MTRSRLGSKARPKVYNKAGIQNQFVRRFRMDSSVPLAKVACIRRTQFFVPMPAGLDDPLEVAYSESKMP